MGVIRVIGGAALVILVGSVCGWAAFNATSTTVMRFAHSSPPCPGLEIVEAGFDPMTGVPHGTEFTCPVSASWPSGWHLLSSAPDEVAGQRAIPVPVGFVLGALGTLGVLLWIDRRRVSP